MTLHRRRILTHLFGSFWVSISGLYPPAIVACFYDFAVVSDPVQQCCCHLGIAEDLWPLTERQVGRDDKRRALVELGDQVEQELPAALGERQIAQFIKQEISMDPALLATPARTPMDLGKVRAAVLPFRSGALLGTSERSARASDSRAKLGIHKARGSFYSYRPSNQPPPAGYVGEESCRDAGQTSAKDRSHNQPPASQREVRCGSRGFLLSRRSGALGRI